VNYFKGVVFFKKTGIGIKNIPVFLSGKTSDNKKLKSKGTVWIAGSAFFIPNIYTSKVNSRFKTIC
jgi:hypothetical protein